MNRPARKTYLFFAVSVVLSTTAGEAFPGPPISFDVAHLVTAEDIASPEFREARPGFKLVKIELLVSTMVDSKAADDVLETMFVVETTSPQAMVEDFAPQTTLQSPYAGNISKEERTEYDLSARVTGKQLVIPELSADGVVSANRKTSETEKVEILPELSVVAASGTIDRGRGVYFRFSRSKQNSLEGTTGLSLILAVPEHWKADILTLRCTARLKSSLVPGTPASSKETDPTNFNIAVFELGNRAAAHAASQYVAAESRWHHAKRKHSQAASSSPGRTNPFDYLTKIVRPGNREKSPEVWLASSPKEAARSLPAEVVEAYYQWKQAKAAISNMAYGRSAVVSRYHETATANKSMAVVGP